jgi:hypothetical protein
MLATAVSLGVATRRDRWYMTAAVTRHYGVCGALTSGQATTRSSLRSSLNGDLSHSGVKQNQYCTTQLGTSVFNIFLFCTAYF